MALRYPPEAGTSDGTSRYQGTISFTAFEEKLTDVSGHQLDQICQIE